MSEKKQRMKTSDTNLQEYKNDWMKKNYEMVGAQIKKQLKIGDRITQAVADGKAASKAAYIIDALGKQLAQDGYPAPSEDNPTNTD